jgi:fatty acid-binding protein DegV
MKNAVLSTILALTSLLATTSFGQSKTAVDSVISNTQVIFKGETIIDVGGKSTLIPMYSRVTNNNKFYTDSTAALEIQSLYKMLKNGYDFQVLAVTYS